MKKRILSLFLTLSLLAGLMIPSAFAASNALSANKSVVAVGETITVSFAQPKTQQISAYDLNVGFDKTGFEAVSVDQMTTVANPAPDVTAINNAASINLGYASATGTVDKQLPAGNLFSVTFKALKSGTYDFKITQYQVGGDYDDSTYSAKDITPSDAEVGAKTLTITVVSTVTGTQDITGVTAPAKGATPTTSVTAPIGVQANIEWYKNDDASFAGTKFEGETVYKAKITVKPDTGYVFADGISFTVDGAAWDSTKQSDGSYILTKTFDATAGKDTPTISTIPTASAITYGQTLNNSTLTGGTASVAGTFAWKTETTAPQVSDSNATEYEVIFTPTDTTNYTTATCKVKLTVNPKNLTDVAVDAIADQGYTGSQIKPEVTVKGDSGKTLVKDTDYTVEYGTNKDVGTGTVTVKAKDGSNYTFADKTANFNIKAASSTISITGDPSKTYDGSAVTDPTVNTTGSTGSVTYTYYTDSACTTKTGTANGAASDGAAPKNAGSYWVKATLAADSNYGSATSDAKKFTISPKALTNDMIVLGTQNTYSGTEQGVAISAVKDGTTSLTAGGVDYTVVSGNKATDVAETVLKIKGTGNYTGTAIATWTLQQATPTTSDFTISADLTKDYTGNPISVTAPTSSKTGIGACTVYYEGTGSTTYTKSTTAPTNAGSYTVTFDVAEGQNYKEATGLSIGMLTIRTIDVSTLTATAPDQTAVAGVGNFNDPTITGVNSESVAGTFTYGYASETSKSHDDAVNMLRTKNANEEVTLNYTFTPSNSNYTGTKTGNFKVTVKDIEFKVSGAAASADNAINSLTGDTAYGKSWNERISVKSDSITASVGGTEKEGTYTIVPDSGALTDRPGVGTKNYTVKFTSTDGTYSDVTVFTGSITVTAKPVTITGLSVDSKVYDGNTTATVTGTAAISGKVDGDDVTVAAGTAAFADKNVGNGKIVTFSSYGLSGADASNYSLSAQPASATANITAKDVTISGLTATTRDYAPGNKEVSLTGGTINPAAFSGDTVTVDLTNAKGTMDDENAGTSKAVTVTGVALSGTDAGNYKLTAQPTGVTVTINQIDPTAPTGLSGVKGQALSTVTLPAGWTWDNPSTTMNTTGSVSFKASYAGSTNYKVKSSIDVTVTVSDKEPVTISGLTATTGLTYNGSVQMGYTGTPSYSPAWTGTPVVTYYLNDGATKTTTANSGASGEGLAPKNAGNYMVTIAIPDSDPAYTGNVTLNFTIAKRTISVKADNKSMTVNGTLPTFTVSYGNFASGDSEATVIETKATASCAATGTSTGSFPITVSGTTTLKSGMGTNYEVGTPESGTLTVNPRSSSGGGGGSSVSTYSVTVGKTKNGTVSVSPKSAAKGDTVTVTVTPDKGYVLETLTVLDKNDKEIKITEKNGKYTFTMPASKVTVKATFMDDNTMLNYFVDVKAGDYFYDAVLWAAQKGITTGTDATHFSPNASCTRAQIVTFLWRAAGSPEPKSMGSFVDVSADSYCAKAVAWAVENGITGGTGDGKFSPNATCTRAQAMTFLWRASGSPAVSGGSAFSDVAANAYYADAVAWAEKNEITGGIGGGLFGSGNNCTRGQIVTFLYRAFNK